MSDNKKEHTKTFYNRNSLKLFMELVKIMKSDGKNSVQITNDLLEKHFGYLSNVGVYKHLKYLHNRAKLITFDGFDNEMPFLEEMLGSDLKLTEFGKIQVVILKDIKYQTALVSKKRPKLDYND